MRLKIHVKKKTPNKNPQQTENQQQNTQTDQGGKMLAVKKQQTRNTETGPKVTKSVLCFFCCMSWLLKYVFVDPRRGGCRLVRLYCLGFFFFYVALHVVIGDFSKYLELSISSLRNHFYLLQRLF